MVVRGDSDEISEENKEKVTGNWKKVSSLLCLL